MAIFEQDPFPGTNYGLYLQWKKVTTPDGQVYYEVPGNPGYVFDPVASNATGRKVFRANPQLKIDEQRKAEERLEKAEKQQEYLSSPGGQLLPVAGTVGGLAAANYFMSPGATAVGMTPGGGVLMSDGAIKGGTALAQGAVPSVSPVASAAAQGATSVAQGATGVATPQVVSVSQVPGSTAAVPQSALGINPALLGAGFIASAPLWAPALQKGMNALSHSIFGAPYNRPYVSEEAAQSKALANQIPGFGAASAETKTKVADYLHDAGVLTASRPMLDNEGEEIEGTQWAIQPGLYNETSVRNRAQGRVGSFTGRGETGEREIAPLRTYSSLEEMLANPSPYLKKDAPVLVAIKNAQEMLNAQNQLAQAAAQGAVQGVRPAIPMPRPVFPRK